MPTITCLPDNKLVPIRDGETILGATLRANIAHAHACGGHAKCSTCRVWILDGLDHCVEAGERERALTSPLGFGPHVRLACQTFVTGDVKLRRLVLDETDLEITSQLSKKRLSASGTIKDVAVLFSDIRGFTRLTETLSAYDVVFVLSRFFHHVGEAIDVNGGYIVDYYGDGVMALFGLDDDPLAPLRSIVAGLDILTAVDRFQPYMKSMYGERFEVGVGLHYGPAVVGTVGSAKHEKLTAVGDTVNIANRIEAATKESGSRMLVSEQLHDKVRDQVTVGDFVRVTLRNTSERRSLFEITGLTPSAAALVRGGEQVDETRVRYAGRDWVRVLCESDLPVGEQRVVELSDLDLLLIRTEARVHAVNNACPHLRLPLAPSTVTEDETIVCRWHESAFDLNTGDVIQWCEALTEEGLVRGFEELGNVSKNRAPMVPLPVRLKDGYVWVALE
jgi:class 3 adenylate cyclase/nitrite reductase/ring-hydroxylating ferredoxin subunit